LPAVVSATGLVVVAVMVVPSAADALPVPTPHPDVSSEPPPARAALGNRRRRLKPPQLPRSLKLKIPPVSPRGAALNVHAPREIHASDAKV